MGGTHISRSRADSIGNKRSHKKFKAKNRIEHDKCVVIKELIEIVNTIEETKEIEKIKQENRITLINLGREVAKEQHKQLILKYGGFRNYLLSFGKFNDVLLGVETTNVKQIIVDIWKEVTQWQKDKMALLCKKYNVNPKTVEDDEYGSIYKFNHSAIRFRAPNSPCFEDLTGHDLKFAEKRYEILDKTYIRVEESLEKRGFVKEDTNVTYSVFSKNGNEYAVVWVEKSQKKSMSRK